MVGFIAPISAPALVSHLTSRTLVSSSEKKKCSNSIYLTMLLGLKITNASAWGIVFSRYSMVTIIGYFSEFILGASTGHLTE